MWNPAVIHPFLVGSFPILFLYSLNLGQVSFSQILIPLVLTNLFSLLILVTLGNGLRNVGKAGAILSFFLIWFFSYGHIYETAGKYLPVRHRHLIGISGLGLLGCFVMLAKCRGDLKGVTRWLNVFSVFLILFLVFHVASSPLGRAHTEEKEDLGNALGGKPENSRDIYYLILDEYARADTLRSMYQYENEEFLRYLRMKGFLVAEESRSNYSVTSLSLGSSLNMKYIELGVESKDRRMNSRLARLIERNEVIKFLKNMGYKIIHIGSAYSVTDYNRSADLNIQAGKFTEFEMLLIKTTALRSAFRGVIRDDVRQRILGTFHKIMEASEKSGPKFVFAHIVSPHPPYVFGADGEKVIEKEEGESSWEMRRKYLNQLIFINTKTRELLDGLLSRKGMEPIIILQADHGPSVARHGAPNTPDDPNPEMVRERMAILNAYYFPGGGKEILYPSVTPVNSFRLLFNFYFQANFPLLENHSYYSKAENAYQLIDVTAETLQENEIRPGGRNGTSH